MNPTLLSYRWSDELRRPWFSLKHWSFSTQQKRKINFFHIQSQFKLGGFHHFYEYKINVRGKEKDPPWEENRWAISWLPYGTLTGIEHCNFLPSLFLKEIIFQDDCDIFSRSSSEIHLRNKNSSVVDIICLIIGHWLDF